MQSNIYRCHPTPECHNSIHWYGVDWAKCKRLLNEQHFILIILYIWKRTGITSSSSSSKHFCLISVTFWMLVFTECTQAKRSGFYRICIILLFLHSQFLLRSNKHMHTKNKCTFSYDDLVIWLYIILRTILKFDNPIIFAGEKRRWTKQFVFTLWLSYFSSNSALIESDYAMDAVWLVCLRLYFKSLCWQSL